MVDRAVESEKLLHMLRMMSDDVRSKHLLH